MTAEQYHSEMIEYLVTSRSAQGGSARQFGDEVGVVIEKLIGVNALSENEILDVLAIMRAAFEKPDRIPDPAKNPSGTLLLLQRLKESAIGDSTKEKIADTIAYLSGNDFPAR